MRARGGAYFELRDIALDQLAEGGLGFELVCPGCGLSWRLDQPGGFVWLRCPRCQAEAGLDKAAVRTLFERKIRNELELAEKSGQPRAWDDLGRAIARATELLEPWLMIFVVGFMAQAFGHYLKNTHLLLIRLEKALDEPPLLLAFPPAVESNAYLTGLWRQKFIISPIVKIAYDLLSPLPGHRRVHPRINLNFNYYIPDLDNMSGHGALVPSVLPPRHSRHLIDLREWYWREDSLGESPDPSAPMPFVFSEEEHLNGRGWLASKNTSPGGYVCFLGRDDAYGRQTYNADNWNCNSYRNVDILNYEPAMHWLADRGLSSIRLGSQAAKALSADRPEIIDYACSGERTEFLDLYLGTECLFYVSAGSGPDSIPCMAHRPLLLTNLCQYALSTLLWAGTTLIFKKFWSERQNKFLSVREIFEGHLESCYLGHYFQEAGIRLVENSPEEIRASTEEMLALSRGTWRETEEERRLKASFVRLLNEFYPGFQAGQAGRLGFNFLKMNPFLLADA